VSEQACSGLKARDQKIGVRKELTSEEGKRGSTMKRFTVAAIAAATVVILFAGKDDIRRFRRMYSM
jgi:hypothetical protein